MRYPALTFFLVFFFFANVLPAQIQQPYDKYAPERGTLGASGPEITPGCGFDELIDEMPASAKERQEKLENQLYNILQENPDYFRQRSATYTVPVVVHVVHQNGTENISEQTVQNGIQHLNDAFANLGYYDQDSGANVDIDFCLARQDPDGNLTNGITRTESPLTVLDKDTEDQDLKDLVRWDPLCYVNIWLVRNIQGSVAGYAYLPGAHGADFDGIVCESVFFGSSPANSSVTVHEMGHYLGLFHTFQGGCTNNDCLADGDRVCDTPPDNSTAAVPCDNPANTCNTDTNSGFATDQNDMNENYMDYGDRFCYHDFTQGQADRMQFFLTGTRSSLLDCSSCLDPCPVEIAVDATPNPLPVAVGTNASVTLTEDFVQNYRWLLGDSVVSNSPTLDLPITELGDFEIVIEVSNDNPDCFAYDTLLIQPFCDPTATVQADSDTLNATAGVPATLGITATDADSVRWLLNGVEIGSGVPLDYTFTELGFQQLVLEAVTPYSDCNGRDTVLVNVTCPDDVSVNLEDSYLLVQFGETVDFASNAMNTNGVEWTLDDMVVGNDENLNYTFNNFGVFDLIVVGESTVPACNVADVMQVEVECGLPLEVTADENFVIAGDTVAFAANGTDIQSYEWYVNGQLVSDEQSFEFPFAQGGVYEVYVIVNFPLCEQRSESLIITVQDPCFYDTLDVAFDYDVEAPVRDVVKSAVDDGYLLNFGEQLVKVDGNYEPLWSRAYLDPIFIMGATADLVNGGYYLAYYSLGDGVDASTKIMKINETGDILWQRGIVANPLIDQFPELGRMASFPNGNALVYEELLITDGTNVFPFTFLAQFRPDGTEVWSRELFLLFASDAKATSDGGVLLSGYNADQSNTLGLVKLDAFGDIDWSTSFTPPGETQTFVGPSFIEEYDDGSFFIGFNAFMENELFGLGHIMRISADGNLRWAERLYDDGVPLAAQQITGVDQALNGDFLVSLTIPANGMAGGEQQVSDIVRITQDEDVRWVRRNPIRDHAITAIRQEEMGELAMFGGFDMDNLLYLTDEDGFSGSCEMQARRVDRPARPLDQEFDVYQLDSLLEYEEIFELEPRNLDAVRSVLCSVEGTNGSDAEVEMLSASLCGDSVTLNVRICNLGNLPIPDTIPVTFYDSVPFETAANVAGTLPLGSVVEADSCRELSFTLLNEFADEQAFLMFNDDGTATLPFSFLNDFPRTAEEECNYYNNLDSLSLEGLPQPSVPAIELGPDTVLCAGDSLLLQGPVGFSEYLWQDGSTDTTFLAEGPGVYFLQGRIECGATARDTIVIMAPDSLSLDLGPDLSGCQNQIFDLNAGSGFETYRWQDNSFDSLYTAFEAGLYWVETTDRCGNVYRDSVEITLDPTYNLELGGPLAICPGDSVVFDIQTSHTDYEWFPGGASLSCDDCPNPTIRPDTTTRYTLVAEDANCFSSDTLTVNVLPVFNTSDTIGLCPGDTVEVFGQSVSAPGTFEQTFSSVLGCDSTAQIVVEELQDIETFGADTICSGQSTVIFGNTVSTPGPYSQTFTSVVGCDSTHTINLTVLDPIMTTEERNLCSGDTLELFGQTITMPGTFVDTLSSVEGCDSIHEVTVNFLDTLVTVDSLTICEGESVDVFGTPTSSAGTYQQTFLSVNGCDSTHFIVLAVQAPIETSEDVSICTGESYDVWGLSLTMAGVYDSTFVSAVGCDSTHTINLSVLDTITTQESITICQGETADVFGNPESMAGDYSMTFSGANNCDSTHTVTLNVLDTFATAKVIDLCQGDTVQVFGQTVTDSGSFSQTFMSADGCDSTHTVTVNRLDTAFTTEDLQICVGDTVDLFGTPTFEAGVYEATFMAANGCDSTHQVTLSVQDTIFTADDAVICEGESVSVFGDEVTMAGDYTESFTSVSGCDSLHTVTVTVLDTAANFATEVLCEGDSVLLFGDWVTAAGTYSETYAAANGCDSTSYVEVTVADSVLVQNQATICEGDSLLIFGEYETEAGTYSQVFTAASGCDSTEVVMLDVLNTSETTLTASHCSGDSTLIFGQYETEAGTYVQTFSNTVGCDSTVTVELSVFEAPSLSADTQPTCPEEERGSITINTSGGNPPFDFSWGHTGVNTGSLNDLAAGSYAVTVTGNNGCSAAITAEVMSEDLPAYSLAPSGVGCEGDADGSLSVSGPATLTYSLDGENFNADTVFTGLAAGQYTLFVQSASGCVATESFTIAAAAALNLSLPTDLEVVLGDSIQLQPQGDLGAFSSFEWTPSTWLSCVDCPTPFTRPQRNIAYTLMAVDTNGCAVDALVNVRVLKQRDIYTPNVFSPNDDGRNDVFKPLAGRDYEVLSFRIYNRWGGLLHEEENLSINELRGWDGEVNGEAMSGGVYLYQMEVRYADGREEALAGEVTLLR
ncbi:MAG: T9SS type B sorting domain-containing protein [Bacteroidetes bacterium]|jgi:gliding motility-associated-like protein|nr:T9SS type B sorting domain-containing protein [Bacteroidota bacterium]